MLGKLMKHEWKRMYKAGCLMVGAMALVTFLGWLSFQAPMWKSISSGGGRFSWLDVFGTFTLILYVVLLAVVNYGIVVYVGIHFYKTMYTDEGYLLHTLPVTKHEILLSKLLVGGLWVLAVVLSMCLSIWLLGLAMVSAILPQDITMQDFWREFGAVLEDLLAFAGVELGIDFHFWFVRMVLTTLFSPFVTLATLFGAISIGQLASKYRVMAAILSYIGILVAESIISSLLRSIVAYRGQSSLGAFVDAASLVNSAVRLAAAIGLYFVSWYIAGSKLNMD